MPRKNPPAKWPLPDTVNPSGRKCIQVQVPDDPMHIAAFRGAMLMLSSGVNWQDDPTHKAKDVALVWREIVDAMDWGCNDVPQVQFMSSGCELSASFDGGETWQSIFNAYNCAREAAKDEISSQRNDGNIQGGGQPSGVGTGNAGQCYDWDVQLYGSQQWVFPIALEADDTVEISNVRGAWGDGPLGSLNYWYCPDGTPYILGACAGNPTTNSNDPMPTTNHMRLVGRFGDVWQDMYYGMYTIPVDGVYNAALQANDSPIADNSGSITFHVKVCKKETPNVGITIVGYEDCIISSVTPVTNHVVDVVITNPKNTGSGVLYGWIVTDVQPYRILRPPTFETFTGTYWWNFHVDTFGWVTGNSGNADITANPYDHINKNWGSDIQHLGSSTAMHIRIGY